MPLTFERSPDTDAVVEVLRGVNDEVAYFDLSRRAGLAVGRMKSVLPSARRILRQEGILFGVVRGTGLRRLGGHDKIKKGQAYPKRVARGVTRELKDLSTVNFEALSKSDQQLFSITRITLNAIRQQATVKPAQDPTPKIAAAPVADVVSIIANRRA